MTPLQEGSRPRLRPLTVGEILDVSIKICVSNWRTLLRAVLIIVVPVEIVSTALSADYTTSSFDFSTSPSRTQQESLDQLDEQLGGLAISTVLRIVAVLLVSAACFRVIAQAYLGETTDWRNSLTYALHRAGPLLWLTLLYAIGLVFGLLLVFVGSIWLYVAWAFAMPALFVESLRGRRALGRSFALVKGRWWRTFGVITVGFIFAAVISAVVQGVFVAGIFVGSDNDVLVLVLSTIAGIVGLAVTTPFQAALITVVYFDLRVRKEGFDLELLASEIGGGGAPYVSNEPATASLLPSDEEVDRTGAPYWPPPPGWRPPSAGDSKAGSDADDGGGELPRLPGAP